MTNGLEEAKRAITDVCEALKTSDAIPRAIDTFRDFLLEKNKAYGNSIYEPVRVFTNASIETLILVRLNDKATRLLKGESGGEDSFDDLLGYLILRKALPLYLESKEANGCADANPRTIPGSVVTESLKNRGLRVGMTFAEVRDNLWTQCEGGGFEHPPSCTEGDPCDACKFLDGALCTCGHPYGVHDSLEREKAGRLTYWCAACDDCDGFSLASWPTESLDDVAAEVAAHVNANVDGWTATPSASKRLADAINTNLDGASAAPIEDGSEHGAVAITAAEPKKEPTMADTKKPRINRATWHETAGAACIGRVLGLLRSNAQLSWAIGELANRSGFVQSEVGFALRHLIETGAVVQHGKAKGTRYAVAGFTDWPAPTPRKKQTDGPTITNADVEAMLVESDAVATEESEAHSLDASGSEET